MTEIGETEFKFEISIAVISKNSITPQPLTAQFSDMQPGDPLETLWKKREWKRIVGHLNKIVITKSITNEIA